jgi:hypothetical protein
VRAVYFVRLVGLAGVKKGVEDEKNIMDSGIGGADDGSCGSGGRALSERFHRIQQ